MGAPVYPANSHVIQKFNLFGLVIALDAFLLLVMQHQK